MVSSVKSKTEALLEYLVNSIPTIQQPFSEDAAAVALFSHSSKAQVIIAHIAELAQIWEPWMPLTTSPPTSSSQQDILHQEVDHTEQFAKLFTSLPFSEIMRAFRDAEAMSCTGDPDTRTLSLEHLEDVNNRGKLSRQHLLNSLVLARLYWGHTNTTNSGFSLRHELWSLVKQISKLFLKPTITFTYSVDPLVSDYLRGDSEKLIDILQRLLAHSLAYCSPNGRVTLKVVPDVSPAISEGMANIRCCVEVSSNIAPQAWVESLLDGSQLSFADLDLPVAAGFAKLMGGIVQRESFGSDGARLSFSLSLPVENLTQISDHWKGRRVLVVSHSDYEVPTTPFDVQFIQDLKEVEDRDFYFDLIVLENMHQVQRVLSREDSRVTTPIILLRPGSVEGALLWENRVSSHISCLPQLPSMIGHIPLPNPIPSLLSNLRKILVVEDNLINQKVVCRILERLYGRCLFPVDNGEDAISQIFSEHQSISLIFMDSDMPYLNGLETTRLIRQYERENYLPKVPIVGMIFHATLGFRDSCLEAGMDDTLHKPLGRQNLVQMVEKHVFHKQELSSGPTGKQTA